MTQKGTRGKSTEDPFAGGNSSVATRVLFCCVVSDFEGKM